jgi:hypothetical protein
MPSLDDRRRALRRSVDAPAALFESVIARSESDEDPLLLPDWIAEPVIGRAFARPVG